jgi:hypothetical protein
MQVFWIIFVVFFSWAASADFIDSLKDYRTYYLVETIPPHVEKLMVVLTQGDMRREGVLRGVLGELNLDGPFEWESDVVYTEGHIPSAPPAPQLVLPDSIEKSNLARLEKLNRLRERMEELYPGWVVQVGYSKRASRFRLIELVPVGYDFSGKSNRRVVYYHSVFFTRNNDGALEFIEGANDARYGELNDFLARTNRKEISVLRFSLPPELEGSSLLSHVKLGSRIISQPYENFLFQLSQAISESMAADWPDSHREAVLKYHFKRHGESRLPPGLKQYFNLPVTLSGASAIIEGQPILDGVTVNFRIPTKEALEGKLDISLVSESLGLELRLKGGITGRRLANPQSLELTIERRSPVSEMDPPFEFKLNLLAKANNVVTNETGEVAILGPVAVSSGGVSSISGYALPSSFDQEEAGLGSWVRYSIPGILLPDPLTGSQNVAAAAAGGGEALPLRRSCAYLSRQIRTIVGP